LDVEARRGIEMAARGVVEVVSASLHRHGSQVVRQAVQNPSADDCEERGRLQREEVDPRTALGATNVGPHVDLEKARRQHSWNSRWSVLWNCERDDGHVRTTVKAVNRELGWHECTNGRLRNFPMTEQQITTLRVDDRAVACDHVADHARSVLTGPFRASEHAISLR